LPDCRHCTNPIAIGTTLIAASIDFDRGKSLITLYDACIYTDWLNFSFSNFFSCNVPYHHAASYDPGEAQQL
jgi:hypothetical protein